MRASLAAIIIALAGPSAALAQPKDAERDHVRAMVAASTDHSMTLVGEIRTGELKNGASIRLTLPFDADKTYVLVGVCDDRQCKDVDINAAGETSGSIDDLAENPVTVHQIDPGDFSGKAMKVEVKMTACAAPTCAWAVGLFLRR